MFVQTRNLFLVVLFLLLAGLGPVVASPAQPDQADGALLDKLELAISSNDRSGFRELIHPASFQGPEPASLMTLTRYLENVRKKVDGDDWRLEFEEVAPREQIFVDPNDAIPAYFRGGMILMLGQQAERYMRVVLRQDGEREVIDLLPLARHEGEQKILLPVASRKLSDAEIDAWVERVNRLHNGQPLSDLMPVAVHKPAPEYPRSMANSRVGGCAKVQFSLDEKGRAINIRAVESFPNETFARAGVEEAEKWRFLPTNSDRELTQQILFVVPGMGPRAVRKWKANCLNERQAERYGVNKSGD